MEILKYSLPNSFQATVSIPKAVRTLPQTLEQLQKAKDTQERNKTFNCLKAAGAVGLLILAGSILLVGISLTPIMITLAPFFSLSIGAAITISVFGSLLATPLIVAVLVLCKLNFFPYGCVKAAKNRRSQVGNY